jgi:hypothetical protein
MKNISNEELEIISAEIERLKTVIKFYQQTVGNGVNGRSSSYHNVVMAGKTLSDTTCDLLRELERIGIK